MKFLNIILSIVFYLNISGVSSPDYTSDSDTIVFKELNVKNENLSRPLTADDKLIIERNRKIAQIIKEVEEEFTSEKAESKSKLKLPDLFK